jgi:septum formation protein
VLVLASTSPRRASLLRQLEIAFEVVDPGDAENSESSDPIMRVRENALKKVEAVSARYPDRIVVAADTIVVLDGRIIEKPKDADDAKRMLLVLGGRIHTVISAVAVVMKEKSLCDIQTEETKVSMRRLGEDEIDAYVATGEPMDKAGAYAAQGIGAVIIEGVEGCFYNVVGLPLSLLHDMLMDAGLNTLKYKTTPI